MAEDYVQAVEVGSALIERNVALQSPSKIEELVGIFIHATKVSVIFIVKLLIKLIFHRWKQASGTWDQDSEQPEIKAPIIGRGMQNVQS